MVGGIATRAVPQSGRSSAPSMPDRPLGALHRDGSRAVEAIGRVWLTAPEGIRRAVVAAGLVRWTASKSPRCDLADPVEVSLAFLALLLEGRSSRPRSEEETGHGVALVGRGNGSGLPERGSDKTDCASSQAAQHVAAAPSLRSLSRPLIEARAIHGRGPPCTMGGGRITPA
jgi:hypothetical protein